MDNPLDEHYRLLLDDSELWPRLLRDHQFWRDWELLPLEQRAEKLFNRILPPIEPDELTTIKVLRIAQIKAFVMLVKMEGLARARELLLRETKH
jgi:hypothetical protein